MGDGDGDGGMAIWTAHNKECGDGARAASQWSMIESGGPWKWQWCMYGKRSAAIL